MREPWFDRDMRHVHGRRSGSKELARSPPDAGGSGERLSEVQPGVGVVTLGSEGQVVTVTAASFQQAEVEGGAADAVCGLSWPPVPCRTTVGRVKFDAELRGWCIAAVDLIRVATSADTEVRHVKQSVSRWPANAGVSAMSCPWAQVSLIRAVAIDATLIGGPNHGMREPAGTAPRSRDRPARPLRHRSRRALGWRWAPAAAPASTTSVRSVAAAAEAHRVNAGGSVMAKTACLSVQLK